MCTESWISISLLAVEEPDSVVPAIIIAEALQQFEGTSPINTLQGIIKSSKGCECRIRHCKVSNTVRSTVQKRAADKAICMPLG